jgi:hypothetical protein
MRISSGRRSEGASPRRPAKELDDGRGVGVEHRRSNNPSVLHLVDADLASVEVLARSVHAPRAEKHGDRVVLAIDERRV